MRALVGLVGLLVVSGCTSDPDRSADVVEVTTSPPAATTTAPPPPLELVVSPKHEARDVAPGEPVTVMAGGGALTEVTLLGEDGTEVSGRLAADGSSWRSAEGLGYGKTYTATAKAAGAGGEAATAVSTFTTARPARLATLSMNPLDGQRVGVGQPFAFYFDVSIADKAAVEKAIRIDAVPSTEGAFHWFGDKEVHWRPKEYWTPGTLVTVDARIYGKHFGDGVFGRADRAAVVTVGDSVIMEADGATHRMTVTVNGELVRTIPISMGKPGHETPTGTYVIMSEHTGYTMDSSTYGVPVNASEGYRTTVEVASRMSNSGIFYHSAPWSVGDQGHRNVSHGCINMSTEHARWLQQLSIKGDVVVVRNSGGPVLEPWDGLGDWQVPWETWKAGGKR